jgi:hypothetical protein
MTKKVKGKTKATGAKRQSKAISLKEFLSILATDARKLGEFLHQPEAAMSAANLSELDKAALRSGVAGMVAARLAGVPLDQAFGPYMKAALMIHYIQAPAWLIHYMQTPPPQFVVQPTTPAWLIHYMQTPPPQFVVQPTTPYMQAPPPYMQAPPPHMQAPPPYMQAPPPYMQAPPPPPPSPQNPR